jgi:hypothetical protein
MSVSIRPLLIPGVAIATAGVVVLGPTVAAGPVLTRAFPAVQLPAAVLPVVEIVDIQLAGFALDLYNALNGWVEFGVQVLQDFFFWNPEIAAGIGSLYAAFEPVLTAVVTIIDSLVAGPTDLLGTLTTIVSTLLPAFGLGVPTLAAAGKPAAAAVAARTATVGADGSRVADAPILEPVAAEPPAVVEEVPVVICCSPQPEEPAVAEAPAVAEVPAVTEVPALEALVVGAAALEGLVANADAPSPTRVARAGARTAVTAATAEADSVTQSAAEAVRTPGRASRGAAERAASSPRTAVTVSDAAAS